MKKTPKLLQSAFAGFLFFAISGCSLAPHYKQPTVAEPWHYKEAGKWLKLQSPVALHTLNQPWWTLYHDDILNKLEHRVTCNNQNLKLARAQLHEARAMAQIINAKRYPSLTAIGSGARQQNALSSAATHYSLKVYDTFLLMGFINYEVDLWGGVKNAAKAGYNLAAANAHRLAATSLSLHAELASDYFKIRGIDATQTQLNRIVAAYKKALYLKKQRYAEGVDPVYFVDQMQQQLEEAKTIANDLRLKRAQLEHAIAVIIGDAPGNFSIAPRKMYLKSVVAIPNLPSTLLRRRPDIAALEQRVRAANASIGVARAAFLPQIDMMGFIGTQSSMLNRLFSSDSLFWTIGPPTTLALIEPQMQQIVFDGFKLLGQLKHAKANYFETVSLYKQTVLTAFKEVEDALVALRRLQEEDSTQTKAAHAAKNVWGQKKAREQGGIATYLDVVDAEVSTLQEEIALISIQTRHHIASVQLIKALGGGWKNPCCPKRTLPSQRVLRKSTTLQIRKIQ